MTSQNRIKEWSGTASLVILLWITASCSREPYAVQQHRYYSENYPYYTYVESEPQKNAPDREEIVAKTITIAPLGEEQHMMAPNQRVLSSNRNERGGELQEYSTSTIGGRYSGTTSRNSMPRQRQYLFAESGVVLEEQNTERFIEERLFKLVQDAYVRRDYLKFEELKALFQTSFPKTSKQAQLAEFESNFYYTEGLDIDQLEGSLVEISYPEAKTWDELRDFFALLSRSGVATIQVQVLQRLGEKVYLFSNDQQRQGYFFYSKQKNVVEDLLEKIVLMARDSNLKVYAALPLRNLPSIEDAQSYLLDESWDPIQNKTIANRRLDLLHPEAKTVLTELLDGLLLTSIDGIVFKDDFTYEPQEGFSSAAQQRFRFETGKEIYFNHLFVPAPEKQTGDIGILTGNEFDSILRWRAGSVKQLLWDLVEYVRLKKINAPEFRIGLELTPEMIGNEELALQNYSTSLTLLEDLEVDFFSLKRRKFQSLAQTDFENFAEAAKRLRAQLPKSKQLQLQLPLSEKSNSVIEMNRLLHQYKELLEDLPETILASGSIDRNLNFHLLKNTTSLR